MRSQGPLPQPMLPRPGPIPRGEVGRVPRDRCSTSTGPAWRTPEAFDDGEALLAATSAHGLEGVVAKRRHEPYRPGERVWVKVKHRHYWRFGRERQALPGRVARPPRSRGSPAAPP